MQNREIHTIKQLVILSVLIPTSLLLPAYFLPELPSSMMQKDHFWATKVAAKSEFDVVFTGDSRIYRGISTRMVDSVCTGISSYNFGFSSAGLDSVLIDKAISLLKMDGQKILVLGVSPNSLLPSSMKNEHFRMWTGRNQKDIWIKRNLYQDLNRFNPWAISDVYKWMKGAGYYERFYPEQGFVASNKIPADTMEALEVYKLHFQVENRLKYNGLIDGIKHAKKLGVKVVMLRMPSSPGMKSLEDLYFKEFDSEIEQIGIALNVPYHNWSGYYVPSYDGSHLTEPAAKKLSVRLGKILNLNL